MGRSLHNRSIPPNIAWLDPGAQQSSPLERSNPIEISQSPQSQRSPLLRYKGSLLSRLPSTYSGGSDASTAPNIKEIGKEQLSTPQKPDDRSKPLPFTPTSGTSSIKCATILAALEKKASGKTKENPDTVGRAMERHGLIYEDEEAFDRYPDFKEEVMAILDTQRSSPMA